MREIAYLLYFSAFAVISGSAWSQSLMEPLLIREYYNRNLDHYFLSTPTEAAEIDQGSAGPGWERTGEKFLVPPFFYHLGSRLVCRFYGSLSPGPNSHFFTVDANECEGLKQLQAQTPSDQPRWNYEGYAFPAGVPRDGSCEGQVTSKPVYRLYNDGAWKGIDSNHRYVVRSDVILEMRGRGWIFEGVAFCALPATP